MEVMIKVGTFLRAMFTVFVCGLVGGIALLIGTQL